MLSENLNHLTKKINQSIVRSQGRSARLRQWRGSERWEMPWTGAWQPGVHPAERRSQGTPGLQGPPLGTGLTSVAGAPVTSGPGSGPAAGQQRPAFQNPCLQACPEAQARPQPTAVDLPGPAGAGPPPAVPACLPASSPAPGAPAHRGARGPQIKPHLLGLARSALACLPHLAVPSSVRRSCRDLSCLPAFAHTAPTTCRALLWLSGHSRVSF